jgi:protein-tyrosine phosphatase
MKRKPKPYNTYWVHEHLIAGDYPGAKVQNRQHRPFFKYLEHLGVTCFLDLTESFESDPENPKRHMERYDSQLAKGVRYFRMPIRDVSIPTVAEMREILDLIDTELRAGRTVYVHCRGGVGRTGTVVACHISRRSNLCGHDAMDVLQDAWATCGKAYYRMSPETLEQCHFVYNWTEGTSKTWKANKRRTSSTWGNGLTAFPTR